MDIREHFGAASSVHNKGSSILIPTTLVVLRCILHLQNKLLKTTAPLGKERGTTTTEPPGRVRITTAAPFLLTP